MIKYALPDNHPAVAAAKKVAETYHLDINALLSGMLNSLLDAIPQQLCTLAPTPAPAPLPAAPVIPDRTETERRLGAID